MTSSPQARFQYSTGHPWYYLLGGRVLTLKQIREATRYSQYQGYMRDDIAGMDKLPEPRRSAKLRTLRVKIIADLRNDISGHRKRALELHRYRMNHPVPSQPTSSADIHTNISLKHNHLVNDFAHLMYLDDLLGKQGDLFG
ncbi:hypothetical protein [Ahrensia sp. 13_GOM-1096m]|uniref:hypothetical protein n=1 Tax=Ahrensia sp. 13_GOM-1096m TaxID=1380380 RepID=UPI00047DADD2|nr:hypothetical protein [Ahrensia sp. 13_GOM-1096m]